MSMKKLTLRSLSSFVCIQLCPMFFPFGMETAVAQNYPAKPIRVVVPFTPGGGTDVVARAVAQKMHDTLGQQALVDNRPGANGIIGTDIVAKAPADGYT